jgi:AcrR family transcriptional regulator
MLLYVAMAKVVKRKRNYNASLRQEQAQMTRQRILDAARRLLIKGTYSSVTMEDIAQEAGVSYQTVYAVFGTKLQLAKDVIQEGFHFNGLEELAARANATPDPEAAFRIGAEISRRIHETCADLVRFMRESGDAELLARYHQNEELRLSQQAHIPALLQDSSRLKPGLSQDEVLAVLWAMTGTDFYSLLVFQRGWTPSQYEDWLGMALISLLVAPGERVKPATASRRSRR